MDVSYLETRVLIIKTRGAKLPVLQTILAERVPYTIYQKYNFILINGITPDLGYASVGSVNV